MNEERDFVTFTDDDGNEFELDVIDYFDHKGKEYAVLIDAKADDCDCEDDDCDCEHETDVYIMQVVVNEKDDTEEFVSPADEDMDELIAIVEQRFAEDECDCEDGCDCEDCADDKKEEAHKDGCGCGCGCKN